MCVRGNVLSESLCSKIKDKAEQRCVVTEVWNAVSLHQDQVLYVSSSDRPAHRAAVLYIQQEKLSKRVVTLFISGKQESIFHP